MQIKHLSIVVNIIDPGIEQISFLDPAGVKIELNCYHN
jgi:hypothetical protein